jgi:hypothetical protein
LERIQKEHLQVIRSNEKRFLPCMGVSMARRVV